MLTLEQVGYVLFEIPSNLLLKRLNPRIVLPSLAVGWGIAATMQGLVLSPHGFYLARFCSSPLLHSTITTNSDAVLGVSEAGLFPGCIFVISMHYKRSERHFRVAFLFGGAALAGASGGILAWAIDRMDGIGGRAGWSWVRTLKSDIND